MDDRVLDGNAAAGLLDEVFAREATVAVVRCAACGAEGAVATLVVYSEGPGSVLRCPACSAAVMRFARVRDRLLADFRGAGVLTFPSA